MMFKNIKNKLKEELDKKTDPDAPLLTAKFVEVFFLRLLLSIFAYVIIDKFIIELKIWQFVLIDILLQVCEWFVKLVKK